MIYHRLHWRITTTICLFLLCGLVADGALAGKPGGAIVPPGIIYFGQVQGDWMSMKGDGSGKQYTPIIVPSFQLHAGLRWSLQGGYDYDGSPDPNGNLPFELFAVAGGHEFQLTSDPDVSWIYDVSPTWSKDDSFISFTGVQNTPTGVIGGLFVVEIDWSLGFPTAGPPTLVLQAQTTTFGWWSWADVNLLEHDWSPDGNEAVFTSYDAVGVKQLFIASFTPAGVATRPLTSGANPAWSPNGSRIAFDRGEIWSIKPEGTGVVRITQATSTSTTTQRQTAPTWSPDAAYLAFTNTLTKSGKTTYSVRRVAAAGGAATNLTSELPNAYGPRWRP